MKNVLITGGSGMVGRALSKQLKQQNIEVAWLTQNIKKEHNIKQYNWNINNNSIDLNSIKGVDTIFHFAGANVAGHRWTKKYKESIYNSRVQSSKLLFNSLANNPNNVKTLVCASAIGIYGNNCPEPVQENSEYANTFLAKVCQHWEAEAVKFESLGIRVIRVRLGVVIAPNEGYIKNISLPIKWGLASALGNGKMITSWIHINDACNLFIHAAQNLNINGAYNAVAPNPASNKQITKEICKAMHRPLILPNVPAFVIKLFFGQMASMLLASQNISANKIIQSNFKFKFKNIQEAIQDVIH